MSIPDTCLQFLQWLDSRPEGYAKLVDVPSRLLSADILTLCDGRGWIEATSIVSMHGEPCPQGAFWRLHYGAEIPWSKLLSPTNSGLLIRISSQGRTELADAAMAGGAGQEGDRGKPAEAMSDEAKALALLVEHSKWSLTNVAKAVGCSRQHLYKMKRYQTARKAMKAAAKAIPRGVVTVRNTHGNKSRDLDAIDE